MARVTKAAERRIAVRQIGAYSRAAESDWQRFRLFRDASETGEHCAHVACKYEHMYFNAMKYLADATNNAKSLGLVAT